jgi:hypothetical protein
VVEEVLDAEGVYKKHFLPFSVQKSSKPVVNPDIQKENAKVVHSFDVEDIGEKAAFCRCWRSKKVRCFCFVCVFFLARWLIFIFRACRLTSC